MELKEEFLLRVAKNLVEQVSQNTQNVLSESQELKSRASQQGFWASAKTLSTAQGLINELRNNLNLAINLCNKVLTSNPDAKIQGEITAKQIQSDAYFQLGLISFLERRFKEAVEYYNKSLSLLPDQSTYLNLGLCFLQIKGVFSDKTPDAIAAFQKCIEIDPNSDIAISAGMELARLGKL
jgi:tetratricopeptide (TPR) repeat protein